MCYSFESSIKAWIITFILCTYMLANPDKYNNWIPLIILTFTQIQIMEAIIWTSMDKNQEVNKKTTKILFFMLWLQPLLNSLIGYKNTHNNILLYATFFYTLILVYLHQTSINDKFISTIGPNGHLVWNRFDQNNNKIEFFKNKLLIPLYLSGLLFPFFYIKGNIKYIPISVGIGTFIYNLYKYESEFSSMWCYTATLLSSATILYTEITNQLN